MLFLLKALTNLSLAATGAVVQVVFLLEFTRQVRKRGQQPAPQQQLQASRRPVYQSSPTAPVAAAPAGHVHVHLDQAQAQRPPRRLLQDNTAHHI